MLIAAALFGLFSTAEIRVDPARVINSISDDLYGSCIEDVNHEIYGGLYGQRIFGESFEEPSKIVGPAGWRAISGEWTSSGDAVQCPVGDGPMLLLERKPFSDGTVEARVQVKQGEGGSAGLLVRVNNATAGVDTFDGYEVAFQAKVAALTLSRHRHDYKPLATVAAPIAAGESHLIRVVLQGGRIRVFLDSEATPRIDFTDRDKPILSGTAALRPWQADCAYRDVSINQQRVSLVLKAEGLSGMWDPIGAPEFSLDRVAFNGAQCQKIVNRRATEPVGIANCGLNRWGIAVRKAQTMEGRIALRGDIGFATVALQSSDGKRSYASQALAVSREWRVMPFHLRPTSTDANAKFVVLMKRPGTLWVDQATLLDGDRFHGLAVRGDIARAIVSEHLTFMRYAGTMVNVPGYRWKNMIGNPDHRPPYRGNWYPYSTNGFGIFDILNFCEAAHIRSAFAINIEETPQDAADLADYLTAPTSTRWGARRAADGHPTPYHPEYIEIGNEEGIGDSPHPDLLHYAERFRILETAIHQRNPALKLVCAAWWIAGSPDMRHVFNAVDGKATAWDIHVWSDDSNAGIGVDREITDIEHSFKSWNPDSKLKVVLFEENGGLHNQQRALGHATTLNAVRRHGDFVIADCPANCLQPWLQNDNGWDQGQVFFTPDMVWGMPPYYAQKLLSEDRLPLRVAADASSGLDVIATRSTDGRSVVVTAVNLDSHPTTTSVILEHFQVGSVSAKSISGDLTAANSPSLPSKVTTKKLQTALHQNVVEIALPAHSVNSIRLIGASGRSL